MLFATHIVSHWTEYLVPITCAIIALLGLCLLICIICYRCSKSKSTQGYQQLKDKQKSRAEALAEAHRPAAGLREKIDAIVRCYCEWADRDWSLFAYHLLTQHLFLAMVPDGTPNPVDVVRELIVSAMAAGEIPSRDPDLAAASAIGTVMQPATYKVYGRFEGPLSDHVTFFADAAWAVLTVREA